jgi:hypothetical protein
MSGSEERGSREARTLSPNRVAAFGGLLLLAFVVSVVMLLTDKNLQTDFGAQSPYYAHWYGVLAMGVLDLVVGLTLVASSVPSMRDRLSGSVRRGGVVAALAWTLVAIVVMVGIVTSYSMVGFSNMGQFESYLFGVTAYPGALSYIPWLYDLLLVVYVVAAIVGVVAAIRTQTSRGNP